MRAVDSDALSELLGSSLAKNPNSDMQDRCALILNINLLYALA